MTFFLIVFIEIIVSLKKNIFQRWVSTYYVFSNCNKINRVKMLVAHSVPIADTQAIKNPKAHPNQAYKLKFGQILILNSVSSRQEILSWSSLLDLSWFSSQENGNILTWSFLDSLFLDLIQEFLIFLDLDVLGEYPFAIAISNPNAQVLVALLSVLSPFNR